MEIVLKIAPVAILILLGYFLKRKNFLSEEQWRGLDRINYYVLIPSLLAGILIKSAPENLLTSRLPWVSFGMVVWMMFLLRLFKPLMLKTGMSRQTYSSVFQLNTRFNGFILLAAGFNLYGQESLSSVVLAMMLMIPTINVAGVVVLTLNCSKGPLNFPGLCKNLSKNPLILGCLAGAVGHAIGLAGFELLMDSLDFLARASFGMSLLAAGGGLGFGAAGAIRWRDYWFVLPKVTLYPAFSYLAGSLFGITGTELILLTLLGAMPAAVNGYVVTRNMGGDHALYANGMSLQVVCSILLTSLILYGFSV